MGKYRVGVIGLGFIGLAHIEAVRRLGCAEVVAVADSGGAERKAVENYIPGFYTDYRKMIDRENLDVVHICTPNSTHCGIAVYALEHGCHVVCEKPLAKTVAEGEAMAEAAKRAGKINGMNFHNRFYPMIRELKEMARHGELGEIHALNGEFIQDWLLYDTDFNWRILSDACGKTRAVSDIGSHWMDLAETVTGLRIVEVMADSKKIYDWRKRPKEEVPSFQTVDLSEGDYERVAVDTEDHANLLFHFDNGAVGSLVVSQVMAGRKSKIYLNIGGGELSAEWCSDRCENLWIGKRKGRNQTAEKEAALMYPHAREFASFPAGHGEGFPDAIKNNFKAIYKSMDTDTSAGVEYATFQDGLRQMRICEAVYQSAQARHWVKV